MASSNYFIVDSLNACDAALANLMREPFVAVDAEGVHLSKTGPLTLVQIGTRESYVYLFDVKREPRLLSDGGLKHFLENENILKVMHSSKNDAEALYWQFRVELRGVFDTQLAQMELDRLGGRRIPKRQKLAEVCEKYCPQKAAILTEDKEGVQTKWTKLEGEYWAKRPMTQEMIKYACQDVIVMIPEVYSALRSLLEQNNRLKEVSLRVDKDIRSQYDKQLLDQINEEEMAVCIQVLNNYFTRHPAPSSFADITDEDVLAAFNRLRLDEIAKFGLPPITRKIKLEAMGDKLGEFETNFREKGAEFEPTSFVFSFLHACINRTDDSFLVTRGRFLQAQLEDIVLNDIKHKYSLTTPIYHVQDFEKRVLINRLRPNSEDDRSVNPVLLRLYWEAKLEDIDNSMKRYRENPRGFEVNEGFLKKLNFFVRGRVPAALKDKAAELLSLFRADGKISGQGAGNRR